MEKTAICSYWVKENCEFMKYPKKCRYAPGKDDIFIIKCKYGRNCINNFCKFNHGDISTRPKMVYNVTINPKKNKKKINKQINIKDKSKNNGYTTDSILSNMLKNQKDDNISDKITIINKDTKIRENIIISRNTEYKDSIYYNKFLTFVDEFYISK